METLNTKEHTDEPVEKTKVLGPSQDEYWLRLTLEGQLEYCTREKTTPVFPRRCFPWSEPLKYFSLRDSKEKEVVLINDLSELKPESKEALGKTLEEAGFCFIIRELVEVEEEFELRRWAVKTDKGPRNFQTRLTDWPREVPGGGLLIQDVHGDIYYVLDPESLPEPGRKKLWAFLD